MRTDRSRRVRLATLMVALLALGGPTAGPAAAQSPSPLAAGIANLTRPLTIEELDETRIAVGMTGDQAVVVAEATISTDQVDPDPACDPASTACPYGRLIGLATDDVVEVIARADVAAQFPEGVTGSLALSLVGWDVELLGTLTQTGAYTVPVSPEGFADQETMEPGTLVAVDGWLQLLGWGVPCPPPAAGLTDDSPFVRCPGGWITPDDATPPESDSSISLQPPGFGIPVQPTAYEDFAPDAQPPTAHVAPPRRAVYLLKRVANPAPDVGSPFGWLVIARLDTIE